MDIVQELKTKLEIGNLIPVVGAGASYAMSGLPGWAGLIRNGNSYLATRNIAERSVIQEIEELVDENKLTDAAKKLKEALGAPTGSYSHWLDSVFRSPAVISDKLAKAITGLFTPFIMTTNYDSLLSANSLYKTEFTWQKAEDIRKALEVEERFLLHLHGSYKVPESLIFGQDEYDVIVDDPGYRAIINSIWLTKSLMFVGCSKDGVLDDDFKSAITNFTGAFPITSHQHYLLMRKGESDEEETRTFLNDYRIQIVIFGQQHDDLPSFLNSINPDTRRAEAYINFEASMNKKLAEILNGSFTDESTLNIDPVRDEAVNAIDRSSILKAMFDDRQQTSTKNKKMFAAQQQFIKAELPIHTLEHYISFFKHGVDLDKIPKVEICENAVLADRLLKTLPDGILRRIKRKNYGAIHNYFFSGNLSHYPVEYLEFKKIGKIDLFADSYGIENMTRILSSLKGVLEVEPDEIFPELDPQSKLLIKEFKSGLVVTTEKEISIRNSNDFNRRLGYIVAEEGLIFGKSEMHFYKDRLLVIGFNSEVAFTWDPNQDYFIRPFYTTDPYNDIKSLSISSDTEGNLDIEVNVGNKMEYFHNFEQLQIDKREPGILIKGIKFKFVEGDNALKGVDEDGEEVRLFTGQIWEMVQNVPQLSIPIAKVISDSECKAELLNYRLAYNQVLTHGILTRCVLFGKEYICLRFMVMFGAVENLSLLLFLDYADNEFSIAGFHLSSLKNSFITYDKLEGDPESIIIGNLAFGSGKFNLIQHFHVVQFADFFTLSEISGALPYPENNNEIVILKTIQENREAIACDDHRHVHIYSIDSHQVRTYGPLDDRIVSVFPFILR